MPQYSVFDVADYFLSIEAMTPKKLQKLCYYAEAWSHALLKRGLIQDSHFDAWVHGPVSPELYQKYKSYKWTEIEKVESNQDNFDEIDLELLESVWDTYGEFSANDLEAMTHDELPWQNARIGYGAYDNCNVVIEAEDMRTYYSRLYIGD